MLEGSKSSPPAPSSASPAGPSQSASIVPMANLFLTKQNNFKQNNKFFEEYYYIINHSCLTHSWEKWENNKTRTSVVVRSAHLKAVFSRPYRFESFRSILWIDNTERNHLLPHRIRRSRAWMSRKRKYGAGQNLRKILTCWLRSCIVFWQKIIIENHNE